MTKRLAISLFVAAMATGALPAAAQQVPPGQSCGGLLCDMGVFGHKVPVNADGSPPTPAQVAVADKQVAAVEAADPHRLPCHDFLCRTFGGKTEEEMAAERQAVAQAAPPPTAEPEKPAKHAHKAKRKHVAKAETASSDAGAAPAAK